MIISVLLALVMINHFPVWGTTITDLKLMSSPFVVIRIGNKDNADNLGGFNLFGKRFGDYNQDIIMNLIYDDEYNTRKLE